MIFAMAALLFVICYILVKGVPNLTPSLFAAKYTSENVSLIPAFVNTIFMTLLSLLFAVLVGVGAVVYLVEYAGRGNRLVRLVGMTAETLSGIPSIVYSLFGALFFVKSAASLVLIIGVLYSYFSNVKQNQLRMQTMLAAQGVSDEGIVYLEHLETRNFRITWVDEGGEVLYDSHCLQPL